MREHLRVLMVEDSEDDAKLVQRALERRGLAITMERVETAAEMSAALDRQKWDLVLADYRLPRFSGALALQIVQERRIDAPFILVSGAVGEETAVAMMKSGAHDFVLKQNLARLGPAVARELGEAEGRRRRQRAEAALRLLAETGKLLAESADHRELLRSAAQLAVPRLADWCVVHAVDDHAITTTDFAFATPDDGEALAELASLDPPSVDWIGHSVADVLRTGKPLLVSKLSSDDVDDLARDEARRRLLRRLEPRSLMVLPMLARDRRVGLLVLVSKEPGRYETVDLDIAAEVADRVALISENARLNREKEEFISTAVHEIKTPIAVIKMAVQLMEQTPAEQRCGRLPEMLTRLDRQCNRLTRLVTDVLEVSRLDRRRLDLTTRPTDMAALVERVVNELQTLAPKRALRIVRNDPATANVDADRIEEVLTNLIDNAIKYSPTGGDVEIRSCWMDSEIVVSVRDHGIGIPKEKQERIFERFYRAHAGSPYEHATSLGVGLYLSREFVARHGGRMWFRSAEREGSTFLFSIPIAAARAS